MKLRYFFNMIIFPIRLIPFNFLVTLSTSIQFLLKNSRYSADQGNSITKDRRFETVCLFAVISKILSFQGKGIVKFDRTDYLGIIFILLPANTFQVFCSCMSSIDVNSLHSILALSHFIEVAFFSLQGIWIFHRNL